MHILQPPLLSLHTSLQNLLMFLLLLLQQANQLLSDVHRKSLQRSLCCRESLQQEPTSEGTPTRASPFVQRSAKVVQREPTSDGRSPMSHLPRMLKSEVQPVSRARSFRSQLPKTRDQTQSRDPAIRTLSLSMSDGVPKTAVKLLPQDATSFFNFSPVLARVPANFLPIRSVENVFKLASVFFSRTGAKGGDTYFDYSTSTKTSFAAATTMQGEKLQTGHWPFDDVLPLGVESPSPNCSKLHDGRLDENHVNQIVDSTSDDVFYVQLLRCKMAFVVNSEI